MSIEKIQDAVALLQEHCDHFIIVAVSPDYPEEVQMTSSSKWCVDGLLGAAQRQQDIVNEIDSEYEIVWDEEESEEEDQIFICCVVHDVCVWEGVQITLGVLFYFGAKIRQVDTVQTVAFYPLRVTITRRGKSTNNRMFVSVS